MTTQLSAVWLKFTLESDAAFGRGDGVAGVVDAEIQHNEYGLPYLGGKTLKGLLAAECAEILWALDRCASTRLDDWKKAALFLFGEPGGHMEGVAAMHVGDARMPEGLRLAIMRDFKNLSRISDEKHRQWEWGLKRRANLESLTALRWQTAMDPQTGAAKKNTLRTIRVILRKTPFVARLDFEKPPDDRARWLLAACTRAFRRAGAGRNRGYGLLEADLYDRDCYEARADEGHPFMPVGSAWFNEFAKEVQGESAHV